MKILDEAAHNWARINTEAPDKNEIEKAFKAGVMWMFTIIAEQQERKEQGKEDETD